MNDIEMTNYMQHDGCDLLTGESGTEPYNNCTECYRYDTCQKALVEQNRKIREGTDNE